MNHIVINQLVCDGCEACIDECPRDGALYMEDGTAHVDESICTVCGLCISECHADAISIQPVE